MSNSVERCECGWLLPEFAVLSVSTHARSEYLVELHCPQCERKYVMSSTEAQDVPLAAADAAVH